MKKLLISLFATLSLMGGVVYAYDADGNPNTKREIAGALGSVPYREYQLVRWGECAASPTGGNLSAGDVVVADCVSDDGVTIAIVSATNSTDAVMGVVVSPTIQSADSASTTATTDFGRRNWGYIQVRGLCTKVNMISGPAAGVTIVAASNVRCATAAPIGGTTRRPLGFALDASGSDSANEIMIET